MALFKILRGNSSKLFNSSGGISDTVPFNDGYCYFTPDNKKFYTAKYDRVFKSVLCDEDNPYLLQEFLSRLLKKKVSIVEFLRNELPVNNSLEKVKKFDII